MDLLRQVENWAAPFVLVMTAVLLVLGGPRARTASGRSSRSRASFRTFGDVLPRVRPVADRDDRLLGDALAQHAGLHALRPQPARADRRPGRGAADDDDGVRGDGRRHHERDRRSSTARRSGIRSSSSAGSTRRSSSRSRCSPSSSRRSRSTSPPTSSRRPTTSPTRSRADHRFRTGGLITGVARHRSCSRGSCSPIRRATSSAWLLGYSGGLGSIAGVLIADYWLVRRTRPARSTTSISPTGAYRYSGGWNLPRRRRRRSLGCALAWVGLVVPALRPLYDYAWFVGFFASGLLHWALSAVSGSSREAARAAAGASA